MKRKIVRSLGLVLTCGIALVGLASCGKSKNVVTPEKNGYKILWSDEFNGKKLNEDIWHREEREKGWTNQELQKYTSDEKNGYVKDGKFVIKPYEEEVGTDKVTNTSTYSSCKLRNNDEYAFTYGRIEVSAKSPEGLGLWPAVWMMPKVQEKYGEWPRCGEIDIMEVLGNNTKTAYGTLHYGMPHAQQQGIVELEGDETFANGFHEYAIEWEPGKIEWFIDGKSYLVANDWYTAETETSDEVPYPAPFNQDFCIQINLAVGGSWPTNPEPGADYIKDAQFEVDYVRVYQKTDGYDENVEKPKMEMRDPDATGNYINNGDFQGEITDYATLNPGWVKHLEEGASATFEAFDDTVNNVKGLKITITDGGSLDYAVQVFHTLMPFEKGKTYKISFDMWTNDPDGTTVNEVCVDAPNANWDRYWKKSYDITNTQTTYTDTFKMVRKSDNAARFEFNVGNSKDGVEIYITNVRVEEVTA